MKMMGGITWINTTDRTADEQLEDLRQAVAHMIKEDPEEWPTHGNVPLAIAAVVQLLIIRLEEAREQLRRNETAEK